MEMRLLQYVDDDKKTAVLKKNCRFEKQIDRYSCRNFHVLMRTSTIVPYFFRSPVTTAGWRKEGLKGVK